MSLTARERDYAQQIAELTRRLGALERRINRPTTNPPVSADLWELSGTTLEPTEAMVTSGVITAVDVEVPGDLTLKTFSGGIIRIFADDAIAVGGHGDVSVSDLNTGKGIDISGTRIVIEADETLMRGMTAAPSDIATFPTGTFGFWLDTSSWQLKVRAHAGSGVLKNLTIGTLA